MKILILLPALFLASCVSRTDTGAKPEAAQATLIIVQTALHQYASEFDGAFSTTADGLQTLVTPIYQGNPPKQFGPFLNSVPLDPWGNPLHYTCPGTHSKTTNGTSSPNPTAPFDLWSTGPDGLDGTADDITSWNDFNK